MSHKPGTDLGGIRTLEDLRIRCYVSEETGCWHCRMAMCDGAPRLHLVRLDGKHVTMRGRRAALYLRDGEMLPAGHIAFARASCHANDCVNPDHTRSGSKKQWGAEIARRGKWKGLPAKVAANERTNRRRRALTDEQAERVRKCELPATVLAEEFGVSASLVRGVRTGARYMRRSAPPASVFAWRP